MANELERNADIYTIKGLLHKAGVPEKDLEIWPSPVTYSPYKYLHIFLACWDDPYGEENMGPVLTVFDQEEYGDAGFGVAWDASIEENETLTPCGFVATVDDIDDAVHLVLRLIE